MKKRIGQMNLKKPLNTENFPWPNYYYEESLGQRVRWALPYMTALAAVGIVLFMFLYASFIRMPLTR